MHARPWIVAFFAVAFAWSLVGCAAAGLAGGGARVEYIAMCESLESMSEAMGGDDFEAADQAIRAFMRAGLAYANALPTGNPDVRDGQAVEDAVMRFAGALDKADVATLNDSVEYFFLICEDYFAGDYQDDPVF